MVEGMIIVCGAMYHVYLYCKVYNLDLDIDFIKKMFLCITYVLASAEFN